MSNTAPAPPRVFISYSHDSEQHREWVRHLAERLTRDGVAVILDQWEIGPGHDVTAFMERGLRSSNWVLIICTEEYVRKANTLKGSVGYERMIVTAEVARNLETQKFIPVLRNEKAESVPSFLGTRIYVDFRPEKIGDEEYERLLRSLHGVPRHSKPTIGRNPYAAGGTTTLGSRGDGRKPSNIEGVTTRERNTEMIDWNYHWHHAVHKYCGNTLYLILVRFNKGSIFFRESLLRDLQQSLITDFKIFHLYSPWDILIRAWADEASYKMLRSRFAENRDIHAEKTPAFLVVDHLQHVPEGGVYARSEVVDTVLQEISLPQLKGIQDQKDHLHDGLVESLKEQGMLIDDKVRFDPDRIQFYITISSGHQLNAAAKARIERLIKRQWEGIFNQSVYMTPGASIQAVLKAQADEYYTIHRFLMAITEELEGEDITTETMLVANCEPRDSKKIDFQRAEAYIVNKEFQQLIPRDSAVGLSDRLKLESLFAGVWPNLQEDKHRVLKELIRARAMGSAEQIGAALSAFFPPFEKSMKRNLAAVIVKEYGPDWQLSLDELKSKEKIDTKTTGQFAIGDLCKVYKRIVLDKRIIDLTPLSEEEFGNIMDAAPLKRNEFAHGEETVLKQWDEWFLFCSKFVPVHHRLTRYLGRLQTKK